jgi:hypothetical protein
MFSFYCFFSYHAYIPLQVLVDFVGAMDVDWLYKSSSSTRFRTYLDDIIVYFQTMPQTTSAVALWVVQLDALVAPYLDKAMTGMFLFTIEMSNVHSHLIPHS